MKTVHFARFIPFKAAQNPSVVALRNRNYAQSTWSETTWSEIHRDTDRVAKALIGLSILEKDRVGIFSNNRPECVVTEYAVYSIRAVSVPVYASLTTAQLEYIVNDSDVHVLFVGDQYQYDRAFEAQQSCMGLKQIVIYNPDVRLAVTDVRSVYYSEFLQTGLLSKDDAVLENRRQQATDEDLANILYTSGASGEPKGVMLTHAMFQEAIRSNDLKLPFLTDKDTSLSFLPYSHILEKSWSHYCLHKGIRIDINIRPTDIQNTLKESRPTCMCGVPRFWEKAYEIIQNKVNEKPALFRRFFNEGIRAGRVYHVDLKRRNKTVPVLASLRWHVFDALLFRSLRQAMGLNNARFLPVAGAHLSNDLLLFFRSVGIPLFHGYGLTESTATVALFDETGYQIGSVGTLLSGLEVRISETGEILLKGKTITPGYYRKPEETAASFTEDGFFKTGDAGIIRDGQLMITDRIKDLYKTSNGKYIAPQKIETALREDPYIDQAAVLGNEQKYVTALIVPSFRKLPEVCEMLGVPFDSATRALHNERVYAFYQERIRKVQKNMAGYEQIRHFAFLTEPFSVDNGQLTDTLKLNRKAIQDRYAPDIAELY